MIKIPPLGGGPSAEGTVHIQETAVEADGGHCGSVISHLVLRDRYPSRQKLSH